jgi:hypothetical protein
MAIVMMPPTLWLLAKWAREMNLLQPSIRARRKYAAIALMNNCDGMIDDCA